MKKIFYMFIAAFMCISCMKFSASAESSSEIKYFGDGKNSFDSNDDGNTLRFNIYNVWSANVENIESNTNVVDFIEISFTISGLGDRSCNLNGDGTKADDYTISLIGSTKDDSFLGKNTDTTIPGKVNIIGDGKYTVRTPLTSPSIKIELLILSSNINFYQLDENIIGIKDCNVVISIEKIITGVEQDNISGLGDVDGDGEISILDATAVLSEYARVAAGLDLIFDEKAMIAADVDGDGHITIADATSILKYYAANAAGMEPILSEYFTAAYNPYFKVN